MDQKRAEEAGEQISCAASTLLLNVTLTCAVCMCVYASKCAIWAGSVQLSALSDNGCLSDWWSDKKLWVQPRQQRRQRLCLLCQQGTKLLTDSTSVQTSLFWFQPVSTMPSMLFWGRLPSFCLLAGWVMSTQSSRDSSLSWRRETTLATRPGVETAATEPSTCSPSGPSSVPWVPCSGFAILVGQLWALSATPLEPQW